VNHEIAALTMRTVAFYFLYGAASIVIAQRTDTTDIRGGIYGVFKRDAYGYPQNPVVVYDTTGRLVCHQSFRDGRLHGEYIKYDSLGQKTWSQEYRNGQRHGLELCFYPSGDVMMIQQYRKDQLHGPSTTYHRNGGIEWTRAYRHGKLHGERTLRDSTGAFYTGEYVSLYPYENGSYTTYCLNGRPQGKWVASRKDGQVVITGNYEGGFPNGEFVYYDSGGNMWGTEYYDMGRYVRTTRPGDDGFVSPNQNNEPLPVGR